VTVQNDEEDALVQEYKVVSTNGARLAGPLTVVIYHDRVYMYDYDTPVVHAQVCVHIQTIALLALAPSTIKIKQHCLPLEY
jgi:hypothetical protein